MYFPICGEVAGWEDSGSHTSFRTALSGGFPCGFSAMGRLGSLHEVGQAMGLCGQCLLSSGFGPKKSWYPQKVIE